MSNPDDDLEDLEARMRKALKVPDKGDETFEEARKRTGAEKAPLPKRVFIERADASGEGHDISSYDPPIKWRWFFYGEDASGQRKPLYNTTSDKFAKKEVERYRSLGITVEVLKEKKA